MEVPELVGINLVEVTGGSTALEALALIANLRRRHEKAATVAVRPGECRESVVIEAELFTAEVLAEVEGREFSEIDRDRITAAVKKRERRRKKRCR